MTTDPAERSGQQTARETGSPQERLQEARPFRLVTYFSYTGFIVTLVFALMLSLVISHQAKSRLSLKSEEYAKLAATYMSRQISEEFVKTVLLFYIRSSLRESFQYELMDKVVKRSIYGFNITRVNIYDFDGMIIYSTDKSLIQTKGQDSPAYKAAIKGTSTSILLTQNSGNTSNWFGTIHQRRMLQTFSSPSGGRWWTAPAATSWVFSKSTRT